MHILRWAAATAVLALALSGCAEPRTSQSGKGKDDGGASAAQAPHPAYAPAALLGRVPGMRTQVVKDETHHVYAVWPQLPGATELNGAISKASRAAIATYTSDYGTPATGNGPHPELNRSWRLVASSGEALGLITEEYIFAGASGAESWRTWWYDLGTHKLRPNAALVKDRKALRDAVRKALHDQGTAVMAEEFKNALRTDSIPMMAFTRDGRLFVAFQEGQVAAYAEGRVSVALPKEQTDGLLSTFGNTAREAALTPSTPPLGDSTSGPQDPVPSAPPAQNVDCTVKKCVALTYDDGPGAPTRGLLDTFARQKAVATFFVLGQQVNTYPQTLKAIVAGGHEIGVHTWDHKDLTSPGMSASLVGDEISRTLDAIKQAGVPKPDLMRPPYGATNSTVLQQARRQGLSQILWDVDTNDWKDRNTSIVSQRAVSQARSGSIILMHDIHLTSANAATHVIKGLRARGFTLVTVSQLLGQTNPGQSYSRR
ncbi:polysaccharide deacetylase family protein [Streptomyces piniterrae]|nr:polysaccharide deacetylase family protein [Streptomyces piniterrae]